MARKLLRLGPVRRVLGILWLPTAYVTAGFLRLGRMLGVPVPWRLFEAAGVLPIPLHYYQPYARGGDLARGAFWTTRSGLAGVRVDLDAAAALIEELGREYGGECVWPRTQPPDSGYYETNGTFGFSSGAVAHCLIRRLRPRRVVEVGAGNSTLVLEGALRRNADAGGRSEAELLTIEPHPSRALIERYGMDTVSMPDAAGAVRVRLDRRPVEAVGLEPFLELEADDVLFIDSSHVVRYGGDVLFLFLEVLPRLAAGVMVHIHDIHLPEPYPRVYFEGNRWIWNEQYLLQAMLSGGDRFETLLPCWWLHLERAESFAKAFPRFDPAVHRAGSSWWMRCHGTRGRL